MTQLALALKAEIKVGFIKAARYPIQTLTSVIILYLLFVGVFYGSRSIAGVVNTPSADFARSATEAIAGYVLWFFALISIDSMSQNISEEAQTGTLEQFYLSRWSFPLMLFLRFLSSILVSLVILIPLLLLLSLSTGVVLEPRLGDTLPVILLTILGLCGFGYLLGAVTLLFKRIGNAMTLVQFGLLFLCLPPVEQLPGPLRLIALSLPLNQGVKLLRRVMVAPGSEISAGDFLPLILNSAAYLLVGIAVFRWAERLARDRGLFGHY